MTKEEIILIVCIASVIANCLLVHNNLKIYTEVVKYKIFQSKKMDDVK